MDVEADMTFSGCSVVPAMTLRSVDTMIADSSSVFIVALRSLELLLLSVFLVCNRQGSERRDSRIYI